MNETEKMFELTQKTYDLVEGIFGSYNNLNKLYENSIKDYDEQNNRLKEAFENAQKNLEEIEKIKDGNAAEANKIEAILKDQSLIVESIKQVQKSIDDFNTQLPLDIKDMNDIKTEVVAKKKEILDSISSKMDELENQKEDISRLLKSASNVAIEGTEVSVMTTGNIIHYSFEPGTALDGVDFINEKADNGVDRIIDKVQGLSTLNVGKGINFTNSYNNNKSGSYFTFGEDAKIGFFDSENHQNTMTMNLAGTTFSNDIFVGDKKVLLEGDITSSTNSNQEYFSATDASLGDGFGSIPPEIQNQKGYMFLSPNIWAKKTNSQLFFMDMSNRYFGINTFDLGDGYGSEEALPIYDFYQKAVQHYIGMGVADLAMSLFCSVPKDYYSDSGIDIVYTKRNRGSMSFRDGDIGIISAQIIDYDNVPEGSIPPARPQTSQITITPDRVAIHSQSLTFNGREMMLK